MNERRRGVAVEDFIAGSDTDIFGFFGDGSRSFILANNSKPELFELDNAGAVTRHPSGAASLERFRVEAQRALATEHTDRSSNADLFVWDDPKRAFTIGPAQIGTRDPRATRIELWRRDPARSLTQTLLNLNGRGDSVLLTTPSGRHILIDSGLTLEAAARITDIVPPHASLSVLLTHPDADHIGNMEKLLADKRVDVDEFVMSSFETDTQTRARLVKEMADELKTFLKKVLPDVDILVTREHGHIDLRSRLEVDTQAVRADRF